MAKKANLKLKAEDRRKNAAKKQKLNDIITYVIAGIALAAVVGLIIYSYAR
ncbi:MAG: hypothetical protein IJB65_02625 [Clostridia bacterium]|nr:hypothetical protein [Clostridia bacterium]